jgi:hypothetical protein
MPAVMAFRISVNMIFFSAVSRTRISFLFFCIEVLIIRYDKMVSHMMPTCAFIFVIKARDPGKDLPCHSLDMCTL